MPVKAKKLIQARSCATKQLVVSETWRQTIPATKASLANTSQMGISSPPAVGCGLSQHEAQVAIRNQPPIIQTYPSCKNSVCTHSGHGCVKRTRLSTNPSQTTCFTQCKAHASCHVYIQSLYIQAPSYSPSLKFCS